MKHAARGFVASVLLTLAACALPARADPPALAGRLSWLAGEVRLRSAGSPEQAVPINWPLTSGDVLSTGPTGRAEVWIGTTALRLDTASRVLLERFDGQQLVLRLEQGRLALRVATPEAAQHTVVHAAPGRFTPERPGEFRVESVAPGAGAGAAKAAPGPVVSALADDDFAHFVRQRDAAFAGRSAARYVSPEMTGIENLDAYGHWSQVAEYGAVWWPDVAGGWAPYREGRWARIGPWGWTWIADEPWGFAPFHYGRWVRWQGRWGWVPGAYVARPVYAPALVGWAGATGTTESLSGPPSGWFPLAPRETYVPAFAASADFARSLNASHGPAAAVEAAPAAYRYRSDASALTWAVTPSVATREGVDGAGFRCNAGSRSLQSERSHGAGRSIPTHRIPVRTSPDHPID